ncbi:MAG: hypothetical protein ACR2MP_19420 [Streptosporangiaceae bacterium]
MTTTTPEPGLAVSPDHHRKLLDFHAVLATNGCVPVSDEVNEALLDVCAHPSLTGQDRLEAWDDVLTWVDLREQAIHRLGHPADVLRRDGTAEEAEKVARGKAAAALARLTEPRVSETGSQTPVLGSLLKGREYLADPGLPVPSADAVAGKAGASDGPA